MRLRALLIGCALATLALPAAAQEKVFQLKLSHWIPATHPLHKAMEEWGASVEKESGGTIKSTVYPAQQLGKAFDHYNMVRDGIVEVGYVSPGYEPGRFPIIGAVEIPFLVREVHGGIKAVDTWYRKYASTEMKDVKYCFSFILDPATWHSKTKKIIMPSDLKGLKARSSSATIATWVTQLGGTNVQASAAEVREVIERGVVDAVMFPWGSAHLFGVDKATRYHMDAPVSSNAFLWLMNQSAYDKMSPAQKKVIDNHCTSEWTARFAGPDADFERAGLEKIKALPGHEIYTLTSDQLDEWKKSTQPLLQAWAANVRKAGGDPDTVMKELQDGLTRYNAAN